MAIINFFRKTRTEASSLDISDGQLIFETDQGDNSKIYLDNGSDRITIGGKTDVQDNLTSTSTLDALSANQGKVLKDNLGDTTLLTTAQTITGAINEVNSNINEVNSNLGDTTLLTTAQTITGAINEVNSNVTITLLTSSSSSATSNVYRIKIGNYIRFVGLYTVNTTFGAYENVVSSEGYLTALGQDTYHNVVLNNNSQTSTTTKIALKANGFLQALSGGLSAGSYWIDIGYVAK